MIKKRKSFVTENEIILFNTMAEDMEDNVEDPPIRQLDRIRKVLLDNLKTDKKKLRKI